MQPIMSEWLLPRMVARISGTTPDPGGTDEHGPHRDRDIAADSLALIRLLESGRADAGLVRDMLALATSRAAVREPREPELQT